MSMGTLTNRLVGVGLSNFHDADDSSAQPALFAYKAERQSVTYKQN